LPLSIGVAPFILKLIDIVTALVLLPMGIATDGIVQMANANAVQMAHPARGWRR
jgi:hypothetical protein